jgi:formate dehydrogenase subunit gamma
MLQVHARRFGALIAGFALALPLAAAAQGSAPSQGPVTAPTKDTPKPSAPAAPQAPAATAPAAAQAAPAPGYTPPTPTKGSTAVPGWNNPPESWEGLSERPAYASIQGRETNRLIQGNGREWRAFRNGPLTRYGGWLFAFAFLVLLAFFLYRGPIKVHGAPTGRLIERFNAVERTTHWTLAISFTLLALSGVIIMWGKHIVLPWLGYGGFSWLTILSKNLHNFIGPLFIFSVAVMALLFLKDNLPRAHDIDWMKKFGGMFSKTGEEVPSGRFNAGEKVVYWAGLLGLGTIVSITGLILDFPNWNQGRELMQQANVIHAIAAVFFICMIMGHAYLGTIGMQGAYRAMRDGYVDETWAKEHHALWYDEVKAGKRSERILPAGAQPVAGDD